MTDDIAVAASGLRKTYRGGVTALDDLSFQVRAGSVFGLLGPNGAGKSTAVRILNTLSRPDGGSASVAGIDVLRHPDRVRRAIGCVAQGFGVDPFATGRENLVLQGRIHGMTGPALASRVDGLLDMFGLTDVAGRIAHTYSGGMRRKLDVAIGLVHRPSVLFLDEPTTGLDPQARAELWHEIERLAREEALTILLTTHYLEEADKLAERLAIIEKGHLVIEGTPDELKGELRGDTLSVELGDPASEATVRTVLDRVPGISEFTVDGALVRARADNGAHAAPTVLAALDAAGLRPTSVTIARPSLDDVYLKYTGHAFDTDD